MNDNIVQLMNIMSKIDIENKFKVLRGIKNNPNSSQRKLAEELGFSLGKLNYCLNALKQKGFIKIQNFKLNPNKIGYAYILTLKGIRQKTKLTINFMQKKMKKYNKLKRELEKILQKKKYNKINK